MDCAAKFRKRRLDFGMLGVAEFAVHKLLGLPKTPVAFPPRLIHPVRLRFGTTDISADFDDVIIKQELSALRLPCVAKVIVDAGANIGITSLFYAMQIPFREDIGD